MFKMTELIGFGAGGSLSLVELARDTTQYSSTVSQTTYTTDARSIGAASATRRVYALIMANRGSGAVSLSTVTIGGVSASIEATVSNTSGSRTLIVAIASAIVPTGTTAVTVATFTGPMARFTCCVISLDNLQSSTPVDTATATISTGSSVSTGAVLDLPDGGYAMGIAAAEGSSEVTISTAWTNLTETVDASFDDTVHSSSAYRNVGVSGVESVNVTATFTNGGPRMAIACISVK